jgi:hypothetical protein
MKKTTAATTEKPYASVEQRNVLHRPGTYVPVAVIDQTPDWVISEASNRHGDHEIISGTPEDCFCVVLCRITRCDWRPPGDWLIYYSYNDTDGTHDHSLCVAARITPQ